MKKYLWTILIVIAVIIIALVIIQSKNGDVDEQTAKCIGENSILYVQLGCHACETQEEMFGENKKFLNTVDCFVERGKCTKIQATPTWEIKGQFYKGVQSIDKLKELTGC